MSQREFNLPARVSNTGERRFADMLEVASFENQPEHKDPLIGNFSPGFIVRSDLRLGKDLFGAEREADQEHLRWVERVAQSLEDDYRQLMSDFAGARETTWPIISSDSSL